MCEKNKVLEKVGKQNLGPFLVAYCQWIHMQKKLLKLDEIIFLARDGYAIQKVYNELYANEKTYYVRLSRKALRMPYIVSNTDYQEFLQIIPPYRQYSIRDFLKSIYGNDEFFLKEFSDINLDYKVKYEELSSDKIFQKTYAIIREKIESTGFEQKKLLIEYLKKNGIEDGKKVGLIECSFKGTSQYMLESILHREISVQFAGLFFYGNAIAKSRLQNRFYSFLESVIHRGNVCVFEKGILTERLMFEDCGSAIGYKKEMGVVEPVIEENSENGNNELILTVQKYALAYAEEIERKSIIVDKKEAILKMLKLLKHPTAEEAKVLGIIEDDNLKERNIRMADVRPYSIYLKSPICLLLDIKKSVWRPAFLVQLPFGCILREMYNILFYLKYIKG